MLTFDRLLFLETKLRLDLFIDLLFLIEDTAEWTERTEGVPPKRLLLLFDFDRFRLPLADEFLLFLLFLLLPDFAEIFSS